MDFQDLYAFYHVASEGSFSKAGMRLRVAQSALSRRVARLEHVLGVTLLQRHGRGVRTTEQGATLFDRATHLMHELDQIESDILALSDEPIGNVRLAMPPTMSQLLGPMLVTECRRRYPGLRLQMIDGFSDLIQEWIAEDKIDLGMVHDNGLATGFRTIELIEEPLVLLAPAASTSLDGYAVADEVDLARLQELPLILPGRPHSLRLILDRIAARHDIALNIIMEVAGINATRGLVAAGLGFSIFGNVGRTDQGRQHGGLRVIPFRQKLSWRLLLARKEMIRTPRAFIELERLIEEQIRLLVENGQLQGTIGSKPPSRGSAPVPPLRQDATSRRVAGPAAGA